MAHISNNHNNNFNVKILIKMYPNGPWYKAKHFRFQPHRHNPFKGHDWNVNWTFMPTTTRNITDTKSCTETFKEKKLFCNIGARKAISGCRGYHFVLHCVRFVRLWLRCKNGGKLQKIRQKSRLSQLRQNRVQENSCCDSVLSQRRAFWQERLPRLYQRPLHGNTTKIESEIRQTFHHRMSSFRHHSSGHSSNLSFARWWVFEIIGHSSKLSFWRWRVLKVSEGDQKNIRGFRSSVASL